MKKIHLTSPRLIKKTRAKNIKQDKELKSLLFGKSNHKTTSLKSTAKNTFKSIIIFILLIIIFVIFNIKFNVYDKISNIMLPKSQNYTVGYINVVSTLSKNTISLNNQLIGETPLKNYDLPPGNYILTLKASTPFASEMTQEVPIAITGNSTTIIKVQTGPTLRTSSYMVIYATPSLSKKLIVFTQQPGAKVYIDKLFIGTTPLEWDTLPNKKEINIEIKKNGYKTMQAQLSLHDKTTVHVEAKMYKFVTAIPTPKNEDSLKQIN